MTVSIENALGVKLICKNAKPFSSDFIGRLKILALQKKLSCNKTQDFSVRDITEKNKLKQDQKREDQNFTDRFSKALKSNNQTKSEKFWNNTLGVPSANRMLLYFLLLINSVADS